MKKQIREVLVSDIVRYFIIPLLIITGLWVLFFAVLIHHGVLMLVISLTATVAATYILLKYLLIGAVLLYKAFAPMKMRDQCRFEPTCSTYMILALQKYGLIRGLLKGIRRIIRCRPPNSGIDYP